MTILYAILALTFPPCTWEDSTNCHWDALARGNHVGQSFVSLNGVTFYGPRW